MIERVPLGARVPALNPLRWDYDSTFAEPEESSWAKLTLVMRMRDGRVVDAELLRPRAWIETSGIAVGKPLPLNLPELNIRDEVSVTAIEACPPIASGAGSVVTARFVTREAHLVASVQLRGPGGELETLTGTELHPIWSVDRADWIPLSQLQPGERLLCSNATSSWDGESERGQAHAIVLGVTLSTVCEPVYNLEIHGEHVYQVGELGVLVHNATSDDCLKLVAPKGGKWKEIARRDGPALDQQAAFSGKQITYRNGKAYIEELELDGVKFDRFRNGVLGEVKDDFGFAARVGKYNPNLKAITEVTDEARRQIAVAKKHGLKLEWYVRKQDLQFFENALGDLLDDITQIVY